MACLSLFSDSVDGITVTDNIAETMMGREVMGDVGVMMPLKNMCTAFLDQAVTNKRAIDILGEVYGVIPFKAFCGPHGQSGCGKKGHLTPFGWDAITHLGVMVKFTPTIQVQKHCVAKCELAAVVDVGRHLISKT